MSSHHSGDPQPTVRSASEPLLVLYTRPACHLCDIAKRELKELQSALTFRIEERDVDDDPAWATEWGEQVPVAFLGSDKVFKYRVDARRLSRLLQAHSRGRNL